MDGSELYIDLLKRSISRRLYPGEPAAPPTERELALAEQALKTVRERFAGAVPSTLGARIQEPIVAQMLACAPATVVTWMRNHSLEAVTLTNESGIDNLEQAVRSVLADNIPGDLMECGVWRGGLTILMRGMLAALDDSSRCVWVADSFAGLPAPDPEQSPVDAISHELLTLVGRLAVSEDEVRANFERFNLLDERVRFLPGWFENTLPSAPIESLAVLRMDADYYDSTLPILEYLYPKVSVGGYIIVDDYRILNFGASLAVDEYRARHGISVPMVPINDQAAYWRKA